MRAGIGSIMFCVWAAVWAQAQEPVESTVAVLDSVSQAQEATPDFAGPNDTLRVAPRPFAQADIDRLKNDPDLTYTQPPTVAESLWDRFIRWLNELLTSLFEKTTTTDVGRFFMYLLALALLVFIILKFLRVDAYRVLYSGADRGVGYEVFHEDIHAMDFDRLIQEATERKEFRLATRLVFLYALKILSDKQLIDVKPGKTNHDYVDELNSGEAKTGLNELSFYFDYAWYGNFAISDTQFQRIKDTFAQWRQRV